DVFGVHFHHVARPELVLLVLGTVLHRLQTVQLVVVVLLVLLLLGLLFALLVEILSVDVAERLRSVLFATVVGPVVGRRLLPVVIALARQGLVTADATGR